MDVTVDLDTPRWRGVPFVVRTGKALAEDRSEVTVSLRSPRRAAPSPSIVLGLGEDASLAMTARVAGTRAVEIDHAVLRGLPSRPGLSAYARVLDALFRGDATTSVSGEEAEAQWAVVEPLVEAFRSGDPPLERYAAGSAGPSSRVDGGARHRGYEGSGG